MVIIKILGGFASQLRHYGVGYLLAQSKHTDLYLDLSDYVDGYFRPFMLNFVSVPDCYILRDKSLLNDVISVSNGEELIRIFEEKEFPDVYLGGETSSYKAFYEKYPSQYPGIDFELFENLQFNYESLFLNSFKRMITTSPGIGVHVRLGDFDELGVTDSVEKYKAAIGWILEKHPHYKVYFFSNDVELAVSFFGRNRRFVFIDYKNGYLGDVEEFFALSMCPEKIIASRSGYSRYASFLGIKQYNANRAISLENVDNLSDEFIFLDDSNLKAGLDFYSKICLGDEDEIEFFGREYVPEFRYDTVYWNSVIDDKENEVNFWEKYYGNRYSSNEECAYVIRSLKKYNRWYINGLYLKALVYARLGRNVLYICPKGNDSFGMEVNKVVLARDMDGKDLGFEVFIYERDTNLKDIVSAWNSGKKEIVHIHDSLKDMITAFTKKISNHHFRDDCLYLPDKFSDFKNSISYINEMLEKR